MEKSGANSAAVRLCCAASFGLSFSHFELTHLARHLVSSGALRCVIARQHRLTRAFDVRQFPLIFPAQFRRCGQTAVSQTSGHSGARNVKVAFDESGVDDWFDSGKTQLVAQLWRSSWKRIQRVT